MRVVEMWQEGGVVLVLHGVIHGSNAVYPRFSYFLFGLNVFDAWRIVVEKKGSYFSAE